MNKKESQAVEKLFADRQRKWNELFEVMEKSRKTIDKIDKSLHKSIWFSGLWVGMLIVQLWAIFYGELHYLLTFTILQLDLMLLMLIIFRKNGWLNGYKS